jgi:hypothetical protein
MSAVAQCGLANPGIFLAKKTTMHEIERWWELTTVAFMTISGKYSLD